VVLLEQDIDGVRTRALALFAGRARRALRLRRDICIFITSNEKSRELNRRHRRKNQPTDVLSFPSDAPESAGDIAISAEIAAANARNLGHSVEIELKILILHGMLHLAGYDHETDDGEMLAREAALRSGFNLPVGLIERAHADISRPPAKQARKALSAHRRRRR
jgi:probable rRNA maturation factor